VTKRVGLLTIFHESNTFVARQTQIEDFGATSIAPNAMVQALTRTQTVQGGFIAASASQDWNLVPVIHRWATPSGVVNRKAYLDITRDIADSVALAGQLDGLLIELHGAMVVDGVGAADGNVATSIRKLVGRIPIVAVIDPHSNLAPGLVESADVVLAYQTNPHTDMAARGEEAGCLLAEIMNGSLHPSQAVVRVPVIAPAIAQATDDEPLRSLIGAARTAVEQRRVRSASILFGFAYADVPEQGMSVIVVTDHDLAEANTLADELAQAIWDCRSQFQRRLPSPHEALTLAAQSEGLVALCDLGDNVGGGAPGNSTILIQPLLDSGLKAAATLCDPSVVSVAAEAGVGARVDVSIGNPSLRLSAHVRSIRDGRYTNLGPLSAGVTFDMGRVAVLDSGTLTLVVQTKAVMANDQNMLSAMGVDLSSLDVVILKGAAAVKAGWLSRVHRFIAVNTPGPTMADVRRLGFRNVKRPLWPLDEFDWRPTERSAY
jgi:microcystin degradation protein MlrC